MSGGRFLVSTDKVATLFGKSTEAELAKGMAIGLTRVGVRVKAAAAAEMRAVFDRPTRFTLNALQLKSADRRQTPPRAFVGFKDKAGSFIPNGAADAGAIIGGRAHYLRPQVFGGGRPLKALESRLRRAGAMAGSQYALPGWGARLDAYGNMSRGEIVQLVAWLGGFGETGGVKNTTAAGKARREAAGVSYFTLTARRGRLEPGVYRRSGRGARTELRQVLRFINRPPQYRTLFDFFGVADAEAARVADEIMKSAMALVFIGRGR